MTFRCAHGSFCTLQRDKVLQIFPVFKHFLTFYFEIILSSHSVVENNSKRFCTLHPVSPSGNILHDCSIIITKTLAVIQSLGLIWISRFYVPWRVCVCAWSSVQYCHLGFTWQQWWGSRATPSQGCPRPPPPPPTQQPVAAAERSPSL